MLLRLCRIRRPKRAILVTWVMGMLIFIQIFKTAHNTNENVMYTKKSSMGRLLCFILIEAKELESTAQIVMDAWANECDRSLFVTKLTNETLNTSVEKFAYGVPILDLAGLKEDNYKHLTDKVLFLLKDTYLRHNDFDWYLKADDKNSSAPVTYGHDYKPYVKDGYHSGGAGYVLSRESLNRIGPSLLLDKDCTQKTGVEDVDIGRCLRKVDVYPGESSLDSEGRERFHPLNPYHHYFGVYPGWIHNYSKYKIESGLKAISETSISFHYLPKGEMKKMGEIWKEHRNKISKGIHQNFSAVIYEFLNINVV